MEGMGWREAKKIKDDEMGFDFDVLGVFLVYPVLVGDGCLGVPFLCLRYWLGGGGVCMESVVDFESLVKKMEINEWNAWLASILTNKYDYVVL